MKNIVMTAVFLAVSLFPCLVGAGNNSQAPVVQNLPVPDISKWNVTNISRIDIQVSGGVISYIGLKIEYNNPIDPREFTEVIHRHIPMIIVRRRLPNENRAAEVMASLNIQKEEKERLEELTKESDPIIYIHWRTKENPRNELDTLDGEASIWLLSPDGTWSITNRPCLDECVDVEFLTENIGNLPGQKAGETQNVFSGMQYRVGDIYHIIRIDRNDLMQLFNKEE